jgi:hypothetical protein
MAFTYSDALTANADIIRFNLGDTKEGAGPRPDKTNFSDAEIAYLLSSEANNTAATARGFEVLAAEWTAFALSEREDNTQFDAKETADKFAKLADRWRAKPDGGNSEMSLRAGALALDFMEKSE